MAHRFRSVDGRKVHLTLRAARCTHCMPQTALHIAWAIGTGRSMAGCMNYNRKRRIGRTTTVVTVRPNCVNALAAHCAVASQFVSRFVCRTHIVQADYQRVRAVCLGSIPPVTAIS